MIRTFAVYESKGFDALCALFFLLHFQWAFLFSYEWAQKQFLLKHWGTVWLLTFTECLFPLLSTVLDWYCSFCRRKPQPLKESVDGARSIVPDFRCFQRWNHPRSTKNVNTFGHEILRLQLDIMQAQGYNTTDSQRKESSREKAFLSVDKLKLPPPWGDWVKENIALRLWSDDRFCRLRVKRQFLKATCVALYDVLAFENQKQLSPKTCGMVDDTTVTSLDVRPWLTMRNNHKWQTRQTVSICSGKKKKRISPACSVGAADVQVTFSSVSSSRWIWRPRLPRSFSANPGLVFSEVFKRDPDLAPSQNIGVHGPKPAQERIHFR